MDALNYAELELEGTRTRIRYIEKSLIDAPLWFVPELEKTLKELYKKEEAEEKRRNDIVEGEI